MYIYFAFKEIDMKRGGGVTVTYLFLNEWREEKNVLFKLKKIWMYYVILKEKEYEKNIYIIWILSTQRTTCSLNEYIEI